MHAGDAAAHYNQYTHLPLLYDVFPICALLAVETRESSTDC